MKRVYFVRHGETNYNAEGLVQDGSSILTDQGTKQALQVAKRVSNLSFKHLVVSDYERTRQTAEPIVKLSGLEAQYLELFREIRRPSEFFHTPNQSKAYQNFLCMHEENFANSSWYYSDEENFSDALERVKQAFTYLESLDGDVLVVTHGHFLRLSMAYILNRGDLKSDVWRNMQHSLRSSNCGVTTVFHDDFAGDTCWRLLTFNDLAHFAEDSIQYHR